MPSQGRCFRHVGTFRGAQLEADQNQWEDQADRGRKEHGSVEESPGEWIE